VSYLNDAAQPVRALLAGSITMAADTEKLLQENAADQIGAGHALLTGHSWSKKCVSCSTLKEKKHKSLTVI
jgi:2,4-dienoyl-CoA reductase-like NADH-dependent reductase (Old Yellow Enzyme family)